MARGGYDFYLDKMLLPVTPQKLTLKIEGRNQTLTLMDEGPVNILKAPGLTGVEFDCDIPQVRHPYAVYRGGFQGASYYLGELEKLKVGKKPFPFIVSRVLPSGRVLFSTDMKVSLEEYTVTEAAGQGFDLSVRVRLKQFRPYGTKVIKVEQQGEETTATVEAPRAAETSPAPVSPQTYTVAPGDCLWTIAKRFYGNGAQYKALYEANRETVGGNPNLIYPGQVLTLPVL